MWGRHFLFCLAACAVFLFVMESYPALAKDDARSDRKVADDRDSDDNDRDSDDNDRDSDDDRDLDDDDLLQANIDAEAAARAAADLVLQGNIDSEALTRAAADGAEALTRAAADGAEALARAAADDSEAAARAAAESVLQENIDAEASARAAADGAEATARGSADSVLQGNIDAEATARITADAVLQANIDAIEQTPGPSGTGDGFTVSVLAGPVGPGGNHAPGTTFYEVLDVCGFTALPFETGVLDNPNFPGRISARAVNFQQFGRDVQFAVTRNDEGAQLEDVIDLDVEFFVRCLETSVQIIATPVDVPLQRVVFVTSAVFNGNLGGLAGADSKCQAAANAIGLPGTFIAWLSDANPSGEPDSRFVRSGGPYERVDGVTVADSYADLVDCANPICLRNPILLDEAGNVQSTPVWTGTAFDGSVLAGGAAGNLCSDWTSNNSGATAIIGFPDRVTEFWTNAEAVSSCAAPRHLYCFEQ